MTDENERLRRYIDEMEKRDEDNEKGPLGGAAPKRK